MQLSIGMIVKNEEKYLDECLTALRPILDALPSELIIVDTGSTDKTVEIAKSHTKKVYHFKWIDDFAAARNETLKYATGEWYMFVDADEILQDATEIIEFFTSKEYKKYDCARYYIKDFNSEDKDIFTKDLMHRMFKRTDATRFVGLVHEYISVGKNRAILSDTIFNHYEYMMTSREEVEAKADRNINLMLKMTETNDDPNLRKHIAESYRFKGDIEKAIEHLLIGLDLIETKSFSVVRLALTATLICYYNSSNQHNLVIDTSKEYFKLKKEDYACDIDVFYSVAVSSFSTHLYQECMHAFEQYVRLYFLITENKLHSDDQYIRSISNAHYDSLIKLSTSAIQSNITLNKLDDALKILNNDRLVDYTKITDYETYMKLHFKIMHNTSDYSNLERLYNTFIGIGKHAQDLFEVKLEAHITNDAYDEKGLVEICSNFDRDTRYVKYMKLRQMHYDGNPDLREEVLEFISSTDAFEFKYFHIIGFMIECNIAFSILKGKMSESNFVNIIDGLAKLSRKKFLLKVNAYDITIDNIDDLNYCMKICGIALRYAKESEYKICADISSKYIECYKNFADFCYNAEALTEEYIELAPKNIQFGFYFSKAFDYKNSNEISLYVKYLKHTLKADEIYKDLISILLDNVEIPEEKPMTEYEELCSSIKDNIISLISAGNILEAKNLLNTYSGINPSDKDIADITMRINERQGRIIS